MGRAHTIVRPRVDAQRWTAYLRSFHAERPGITEQAFRHIADDAAGTPYEWLLEAVGHTPGRVVDVACGNAALLPWLGGHDSYLGVDTSQAELELAVEQGRGPVMLADARHLPLPDASVDTAVSSMGLMLIRPVTEALAEIRRVLVPGGALAMLLPAVWPVALRDAVLGVPLAVALRGPGSMPQHFSPRRITGLLSANGMTVAEVSRRRFPFGVHTAGHASLAVRSLYTPGRSPHTLARAEALLSALARPGAELPVPLMRVVARA